MASDIWLRTILIVREETRCRHIGYSYRLTARVLLYAPSHRQDNTYHGLCYTSCGALAGTRNSSMGPPHEGSIRRPTAPWANALPLSYVPLPLLENDQRKKSIFCGMWNASIQSRKLLWCETVGELWKKLEIIRPRYWIHISSLSAIKWTDNDLYLFPYCIHVLNRLDILTICHIKN